MKVKSVRTYYYGVGYLGTYIFDTRKKFRNIAIKDGGSVKAIRASSIQEARKKVREARIEEFTNSLNIFPEPKEHARV